jgi:hypothetical protein
LSFESKIDSLYRGCLFIWFIVWFIEEVDQVFPDVDDTDGLDPEAEFEAWKLRELKRLRRDREALIQLSILFISIAPSIMHH